MEMDSDVASTVVKSIANRVKARRQLKKKAKARGVTWSKYLVEERIIISSSEDESEKRESENESQPSEDGTIDGKGQDEENARDADADMADIAVTGNDESNNSGMYTENSKSEQGMTKLWTRVSQRWK